jgi:hypothetical protein
MMTPMTIRRIPRPPVMNVRIVRPEPPFVLLPGGVAVAVGDGLADAVEVGDGDGVGVGVSAVIVSMLSR